jgi:hypothetical protein
MKRFNEYLAEAELIEGIPSIGDSFDIEIAREEVVLETTILDVFEDGILIEADDTMIRILMHVGYLSEDSNMPTARDSISPIHSNVNKERAADNGDDLEEAEYQGHEVPLNKPMQGDVKKSKVYVKNANGNVVKVNFGDKDMTIKKNNPERRKSFRARHHCESPGPKTSAKYWSCRAW